MAGTKEIKRRIKSVKNTKKITKAMELVAASKMKRAVSSTLASRLYAGYSWEVLTSIARNIENISSPYFSENKSEDGWEKILIVLITSNRGLCGSYNAQALKKYITLHEKVKGEKTHIDILPIGKKGQVAAMRLKQSFNATFNHLPDNISLRDVSPISKLIFDQYNKKEYQKVFVVYTNFVSALTQKANFEQILPITKKSIQKTIDLLDSISTEEGNKRINRKIDYLVEGEQEKLIESLAEKITKMQIYQMILESNASEQSSRMVAMKNASEASGEMIDDLTLMFNKARQANITREISEISAGMASVS